MLQYFTQELVSVTLTAGTAGSYGTDGEWTPAFAAGVTISIIAPQPVSANFIQMLEDGERRADYVESWSPVKVFSRESTNESDRITWKGTVYKVVQADDRATLGNYYKFVMRRLEAAA